MKYTDETETVVRISPTESCIVTRQDVQDHIMAGGIIDPAFTAAELAAKAAEVQAIADRRANVITKLSGMTDFQIDSYIDANVANLTGAVAYLKRLTKVTRDLAVESGVK